MYKLCPISEEVLDRFVFSEHPEANFLQTSNWGKVHEAAGEKALYLGLFKGERLIGSALAVLKLARRGRYLELPGGPLLDWRASASTSTLEAFMCSLAELAKSENCVFVRMRPNIPDTPANRALAKRLGLVLSPMHLHAEHTIMLDLEKSEDLLLAEMRRQTRYEIRRAKKLGIEVSYASTPTAFREFFALQTETAARQHFITSSEALVMAQQRVFGDHARIYTAKKDGRILAQGLILLQAPEAVYHEAASTLAGRSLPGAYALQWQVIKDAKKLGLKRYNLFGIAPPNSPKHRYAGVTTFKAGFGGEQIAYLPAHDLVIRPFRYQAVRLLEQIRKKRRHL